MQIFSTFFTFTKIISNLENMFFNSTIILTECISVYFSKLIGLGEAIEIILKGAGFIIPCKLFLPRPTLFFFFSRTVFFLPQIKLWLWVSQYRFYLPNSNSFKLWIMFNFISGLTMLLPYILNTRSIWGGNTLRIFTLTNDKSQIKEEEQK